MRKELEMRIQFGVTIKNRHGHDIKVPDETNPPQLKSLTLGDLCCSALDAPQQGEQSNAKEKMRRWELIRKITEHEATLNPLEILDADLEMIKERIFRSNYHASVCGSAVDQLVEATEVFSKSKKAA